jgi:hypothetical protein
VKRAALRLAWSLALAAAILAVAAALQALGQLALYGRVRW